MKRVLAWFPLYVPLIFSAVVAGLIVFGTAMQPPPAPAITGPFAAIDDHDLPALQRYRARDGTQLTFREYPGPERQVALLIHGSAGSSRDLHPLALALQAAGVTVLVPDLRGHGWNRPHGDIVYVGQLDDDVTDFIATQKPRFRSSKWTAVGFSSGGGFTLRIAAEASLGKEFDRYILISPYLRHDAPSVRGTDSESKRDLSETPVRAQSWAAVSIGRIIGLTIINYLGVHVWDGLPVLGFPVPTDLDAVTCTYSWRLLQNFGAHQDYLADIRGVNRPMRVFVGRSDELLDPEKLKIEFQTQRQDVPVVILPGLGHSDMVTRPEAIRAIVGAVIAATAEAKVSAPASAFGDSPPGFSSFSGATGQYGDRSKKSRGPNAA
jgi:pimeloyl-ACP methyl ester carboxylesterase